MKIQSLTSFVAALVVVSAAFVLPSNAEQVNSPSAVGISMWVSGHGILENDTSLACVHVKCVSSSCWVTSS